MAKIFDIQQLLTLRVRSYSKLQPSELTKDTLTGRSPVCLVVCPGDQGAETALSHRAIIRSIMHTHTRGKLQEPALKNRLPKKGHSPRHVSRYRALMGVSVTYRPHINQVHKWVLLCEIWTDSMEEGRSCPVIILCIIL